MFAKRVFLTPVTIVSNHSPHPSSSILHTNPFPYLKQENVDLHSTPHHPSHRAILSHRKVSNPTCHHNNLTAALTMATNNLPLPAVIHTNPSAHRNNSNNNNHPPANPHTTPPNTRNTTLSHPRPTSNFSTLRPCPRNNNHGASHPRNGLRNSNSSSNNAKVICRRDTSRRHRPRGRRRARVRIIHTLRRAGIRVGRVGMRPQDSREVSRGRGNSRMIRGRG